MVSFVFFPNATESRTSAVRKRDYSNVSVTFKGCSTDLTVLSPFLISEEIVLPKYV